MTPSNLSHECERLTIRAPTPHRDPVYHTILPTTTPLRDQHVISCYTNTPRARLHGHRGRGTEQVLVSHFKERAGHELYRLLGKYGRLV